MKKILFIVVLIFSILTTTTSAYAYFDEENTPVLTADERLYVLDPQLVTQNKYLIPESSLLGVNDTYTYTFKYEAIVENNVDLESEITNIVWSNSNLSDEELNALFNFEIQIDHIETVSISNGLFSQTTSGELVEISVNVSMNNIALLHNYDTQLGDDLSFSYLLTVSKVDEY